VAAVAAGRVGLLLPQLDPAIPFKVHSADATAANARVASLLLGAGVVREADVPRTWHDPLTICETALQRWLERHLGQLRCLSPWFSLALTCDGAPCESIATGEPDGVCIRWGESEVLRWDIGLGMAFLENQASGLGAAILDVMDLAAGRLYPLFTPRTALDTASFLYWHGEDDESLALDEMCSTPEERESMRAEMVTLEAMQEAFPPWALTPPSLSSAGALLARMALSDKGPEGVRRAAALAAELAKLPARAEYRPDEEGLFIGFGAVLCWQPEDLAMRISDDLAQYAWQDEYVDHSGEVRFALDDPAQMRRWLRHMRPLLRGVAILDELIWMLVEGYCSQEKGG
jgi:PRTRC genetic system protein F